ncbi:MAG: CvpA family protein [Chloroflexota bacterium]
MAWPDLALLVILAAFALNGAYQGLSRQLLNALGLVLGLVLAGLFYRPLAGLLARSLYREVAIPAAYVIILLGVWIAANLAGFRLRGAARSNQQDWVDALGGALLGALTGIVLLGIAIAGAASLGIPLGVRLAESAVGAWLVGGVALLRGMLGPWLP